MDLNKKGTLSSASFTNQNKEVLTALLGKDGV